jgi:hypothetical protein
MSDETPASEVVQVTQTAESEPVVAAIPTETTETPANTEVKLEAAPKKHWAQVRIDQITKERWEEKRRADLAEAEASDLRAKLYPQQGQTPAQNSQAFNEAIINEKAERIATQRVQENEFNAACNRTYNAGKQELGEEFDKAIQGFNMFGGLGQHPDLVRAANSIPDGHKVLAHLGANLDEAARIINLPPVQLGIEIAKLSAQNKANVISQAPSPNRPINGGSVNSAPGPDDNGEFKSHEDFKKWRAQQFKKRN